ncbi:hypothetical protein MJO29_011026, partial [Puccinia striiformis f. sp. tritici]
PHVERTWEETIEHTYNLYNLFIRKNITAVKAQRIIYGVTDSLNNRFIDGKRKKSSASLKQLILALEEADITEFKPADIKSTLNLQHDCHTGKCSVTNTRSTKIERLATTIKTLEVRHRDDLLLADLPIKSISPQEWLEVCSLGLSCWGIVEAPAAAPCPTPADSPVETPPETAVQTP